MSEPKRLVDECPGALERSLLQAGRRLPNTERRRLKVMAALGVGGAALLSSKTSLAVMSSWKKTLLSAVITCGGVGGVVAYQQLYQSPPHRAEVTANGPRFVVGEQAAPPVAGASAEPAQEQAPEPAEIAESPAPSVSSAARPSVPPTPEPGPPEPGAREPEPVTREAAREGPPRSTSSARGERAEVARLPAARTAKASSQIPSTLVDEPPKAAADSLAEELALLDRARVALRSGHSAQALRHLQQYEGRFPNGSLGFEAEVLRVQVLFAAGSREAASERAKRLLRRNPNSVAAARLKRYVVD